MDGLLIWLSGAVFAVAAACTAVMLFRAAQRTPVSVAPLERAERAQAPCAWLYCEEGPPLERNAAWFPLRTAGRTVFGDLPRAPTADTDFYYLSAYDVARDHLVLFWDPEAARYRVSAGPGGLTRHNNEVLPAGAVVHLTDGDILDVGELIRFRFSLTGPAE